MVHNKTLVDILILVPHSVRQIKNTRGMKYLTFDSHIRGGKILVELTPVIQDIFPQMFRKQTLTVVNYKREVTSAESAAKTH